MRYRNTLFILVIMLMLAACSSESNGKKESEDSKNKEITLENVVSNEANAIDGSDEIKEAYQLIKDLEKPGFVTPKDELQYSNFGYVVEDEELVFSEAYYIAEVYSTVTYKAYKNYDEEEDYQYIKSNLDDTKNIDNGSLELLTGTDKESGKNFVLGIEDDFLYTINLKGGDTYDDITDLAAKTLKTEEEGAYDIYYDHVGLDIEHVKLPTLHPDKISMANISSWYNDHKGIDLVLRYETPDEFYFNYTIMDNDRIIENEEYKEIETDKLDDGTEVTLYEEERKDQFDIYIWTDGIHYYEMKVDQERSPASEETIYAIIESSLSNEVSLDVDGLFDNTNSKPDLGSDEKKLRNLFSELN